MEIPSCDASKILQSEKTQANAGCVILDGKQILLVKLYKNNQLSIPGGSYNYNENAACTAHRETYEETGINSKILQRIMIADNGFHIFLCEAKELIDLDYSKKYEIKEILLLSWDQIHNYRYPDQLEQIRNLIEK